MARWLRKWALESDAKVQVLTPPLNSMTLGRLSYLRVSVSSLVRWNDYTCPAESLGRISGTVNIKPLAQCLAHTMSHINGAIMTDLFVLQQE